MEVTPSPGVSTSRPPAPLPLCQAVKQVPESAVKGWGADTGNPRRFLFAHRELGFTAPGTEDLLLESSSRVAQARTAGSATGAYVRGQQRLGGIAGAGGQSPLVAE